MKNVPFCKTKSHRIQAEQIMKSFLDGANQTYKCSKPCTNLLFTESHLYTKTRNITNKVLSDQKIEFKFPPLVRLVLETYNSKSSFIIFYENSIISIKLLSKFS